MSAIGPFPHPAEGVKPPAPPSLTEDQLKKYNEVLTAVRSWESLPKSSAKGAETAPLSDSERIWLSRECLLRYLRATKWHVPQAIKRLHDTVVWRREYGAEGFTAEYISEENVTGKQVILGFDNDARPCLYLLPNKQNTPNSPKQIQHLVYMLEQTLSIAPPGQESLALLIDFRNSSSGSQPSIATGRQVLSILQNHYPERLGRALITHLPWYVTAFLKIISPFIDPVTKTKMRYNEPLTDHIPASQLMKNAGGEVDFVYDHNVYWPALDTLATERRKGRMQRWEAAGKIIGESEIYLWGGEEQSIGGGEQKDITMTEEKPAEKQTEVKADSPEGGEQEGSEYDAVAEKKAAEVADGVAKLDVKDEPVNVAAA